jgi:2-hydroxychromene-2-carboxylate isomerase
VRILRNIAAAWRAWAGDLARSDAIAKSYADATQEARRLKIFGSPSFVTHGELFWGDDRLEDAVAWHTRRSLQPAR